MSWFKNLFGGKHKADAAIPDLPEKPKATYGSEGSLLAEAAAARQAAAQKSAEEQKHRQVLGEQAVRLKNTSDLYRFSEPKISRRRLLIAGGSVVTAGLLGYIAWRALKGPGDKVWPTPVSTRIPMPTPIQGEPLALTLAPGVEMVFVRVPAGEFTMGSSDADWGSDYDEKPQHKVHLDEYMIGKYEVTVAQYGAFVRATGYNASNDSSPAGKGDHPVTMVSWDDAVAFCRWASEVTGRDVRLPTEAEWEKAARGTDARIYPWGSEPPDNNRCNYENKVGTMPVGSYSPAGDSPYGCADIAGNVWEWVSDWYQKNYYLTAPNSNPTGPTNGDSRVLRGGGWYGYCYYNRTADRTYSVFPDSRSYDYGFRCAVSPGE
ncbi:MAG: formylglycine-generating enzyme family protein [Anaerolineae bacterium]